MKACVIFDTRYGNTERVARALEAGLKETGIQTACMSVRDVVIDSLDQYDLICIGGPTHSRTASKSMQEFLELTANARLLGKHALAFDTRRDSLVAGSAAKYIEAKVRNRGMKMFGATTSAIIVSSGPERKRTEFKDKSEWKEWRHRNETLQEGEEKKFEQLGRSVGAALATKPRAANL